MSYIINLILSKNWTSESSIEKDEEGIEVSCLWANAKTQDPNENNGSIEMFVGDTPEGSDAKVECINNYLEVIGTSSPDEDIPIIELTFMGATAYAYEAQDDSENPVILLCVEPEPGILVLAIFSHSNDEKLAELIEYVSDNLTISRD